MALAMASCSPCTANLLRARSPSMNTSAQYSYAEPATVSSSTKVVWGASVVPTGSGIAAEGLVRR